MKPDVTVADAMLRLLMHIDQVSTDRQYASIRRLFGAYQRAVASFASESEICA
jgi:hypothetical protein